MSAVVAAAAPVAVIAVTGLALLGHPLLIVAATACEVVAVGAAASALTRSGARRAVEAVAAILAQVAPLVMITAFGDVPYVVVVIALVAVTVAAARYALGPDTSSLRGGSIPGVEVGRAARPVLIMNPEAGGGKVERYDLVDQARRRNIEPIVMTPEDDLRRLAQDAVARGADVIGIAGGDGSQAAVAGVAMHHDIAFVCVPAGTRNHFAMDLGLDRTDVVGALDAFGDARERRIDVGLIGEKPFVNNASMGLYAKIVQSPQYRERALGAVLDMLPSVLGAEAASFDLRFTLPDGTERLTADLVLVSNNPYEVERAEGFGSRRRIDAGVLGIVAASFQPSEDVARFLPTRLAGRARRLPRWRWTDTTFHVRSAEPIELSVDGEAVVFPPPIRFRILPSALRVRIPRHASGLSPAAMARTPRRAAIAALVRTATGRSVTP